MAFKILRKNCCGLDVHKTWIFACIGITDSNGRTEYSQSSSKEANDSFELCGDSRRRRPHSGLALDFIVSACARSAPSGPSAHWMKKRNLRFFN